MTVMARQPKPLPEHGSVARYARCTSGPGGRPCAECRAANSERARRYRATGSTVDPNNVTPLHVVVGKQSSEQPEPPAPREMGEAELAVIEECKAYQAATDRPGELVQARRMAAILDDPGQRPNWPRASAELHKLMLSLRGTKRTKSRGRLAAVQSLTAAAGRRSTARES